MYSIRATVDDILFGPMTGASARGTGDGAECGRCKHESVRHGHAPARDARFCVPRDICAAVETSRLAALFLPESGESGCSTRREVALSRLYSSRQPR